MIGAFVFEIISAILPSIVKSAAILAATSASIADCNTPSAAIALAVSAAIAAEKVADNADSAAIALETSEDKLD